MRNLVFLILILLLVPVFSINGRAAQSELPVSIDEIPVFPGAERDYTAEDEQAYQDEGWSEDVTDNISLDQTRIYLVKAAPEEVVSFYINELGAKEGIPLDLSSPLDAGLSEGPWYELEFYDESAFENQYEYQDLIYDGEWVKSCLSTRKNWGNEQWINAAYFEWYQVLASGETGQYSVYIEDASFDMFNKTYQEGTRIYLNVLIEKSEEEYEYEQDMAMDQQLADICLELTENPPDERTLGVAIYPGAVLNVEYSAGMSLDNDYLYYIYLSTDQLEKVLSFYEEELGKKAVQISQGYIIALKGELPIPEEAIVIEPNILIPGSNNTVISIQKYYQE